jgi:hypothetical protein
MSKKKSLSIDKGKNTLKTSLLSSSHQAPTAAQKREIKAQQKAMERNTKFVH